MVRRDAEPVPPARAGSHVMPRFGIVSLRSGSLNAEIQPDFGGRLIALYDKLGPERIDWIVPARPASAEDSSHVKAGCFPMVPYCNRIADGRFDFKGRGYGPGASHPWDGACHGHGFLRAWQVVDRSGDAVAISYEYRGADWPSAYRARQLFRLAGGALEVGLSLENVGEASMPAGFGLHPYFPGRDGLSFAVGADRHWPILPGFRTDHSEPSPLGRTETAGARLAAGEALCLSEWDGTAQVEWPRRKRRIGISATEAFTSCVLFAPVDSGAFCLEPSSHVIGALNMPERRSETGLRILAPGEAMAGTVTFDCQIEGHRR